MLSATCGVPCSERCELLLSLAYLMSPESLVAIAHRLVNDRDRSAIKIAVILTEMPTDKARELALKTLAMHGMSTDQAEDPSSILSSVISDCGIDGLSKSP